MQVSTAPPGAPLCSRSVGGIASFICVKIRGLYTLPAGVLQQVALLWDLVFLFLVILAYIFWCIECVM